jgi:xanthine dehydrogenase accessory factor
MNLVTRMGKPDATHDPIEAAHGWLDEFGKVALATMVSTWGSAPVPVGDQLVVGPGDRFEGSVSGGCVELGIWYWRRSCPCGGTIKILVESLSRTDIAYLNVVLAARYSRTKLCALTNLANGSRQILEDSCVQEGPPHSTGACKPSSQKISPPPYWEVGLFRSAKRWRCLGRSLRR